MNRKLSEIKTRAQAQTMNENLILFLLFNWVEISLLAGWMAGFVFYAFFGSTGRRKAGAHVGAGILQLLMPIVAAAGIRRLASAGRVTDTWFVEYGYAIFFFLPIASAVLIGVTGFLYRPMFAFFERKGLRRIGWPMVLILVPSAVLIFCLRAFKTDQIMAEASRTGNAALCESLSDRTLVAKCEYLANAKRNVDRFYGK